MRTRPVNSRSTLAPHYQGKVMHCILKATPVTWQELRRSPSFVQFKKWQILRMAAKIFMILPIGFSTFFLLWPLLSFKYGVAICPAKLVELDFINHNLDPALACPLTSLAKKVYERINFVPHFYPRPVLAFGYCHRPCLCVCQCVCVNHLLVRTITHQPFKLESPNLKHSCKTPWLRSL